MFDNEQGVDVCVRTVSLHGSVFADGRKASAASPHTQSPSTRSDKVLGLRPTAVPRFASSFTSSAARIQKYVTYASYLVTWPFRIHRRYEYT